MNLEIDIASAKVRMVMAHVDLLDKDDVEALRQARDELESNIGHNQSVSIVAVACGGRMYEPDEDRAKIAELDGIIALAEARLRLRGIVEEKAQRFDGNMLYRY